MDEERLRAESDRDQLWASLRALRSEIDRIAAGGWTGSERDQQIAILLARIVAAELRYRAESAE